MSTYDNDPRVQILYPDWWWLVTVDTTIHPYVCLTGKVAVVKGDDGVHRAFEDLTGVVGTGPRMGEELPRIPSGGFDTVVHALIGDPQ